MVAMLGVLLKDEGDLAEAESLLRRALQIREETLGPTHLDTLGSVSSLGSLLTHVAAACAWGVISN